MFCARATASRGRIVPRAPPSSLRSLRPVSKTIPQRPSTSNEARSVMSEAGPASADFANAVSIAEKGISILNDAVLGGIEHLFQGLAWAITSLENAINDPWLPHEIWFVLAWRLLHKALLRVAFFATQAARILFATHKHRSIASRRAMFSEERYQDSFFGFVERPVGQLTWVYAFLWSIDMLQRTTSVNARFIKGIDEGSYTIWAVFLIVQIIEHYLPRNESLQALDKTNPGASDALVRLSTLAAYTLGAAGVLQAFGLTTGAIGLASVGGLAFSLASKSLVENLMGGVFLVVRQPFRVGEKVEIKDIKGKVAKIGWLTTSVVLTSGSPIYVPNAIFISSVIQNRSRNTHVRLEAEINVFLPDAEKVPQIVEDIEDFLADWALVDWPGKTRTSPKTITTPQVGVTNVQEDGVTVGVSLYLGPCPGKDSSTLAQGRHELYLALLRILRKNGARLGTPLEIQYPDKEQYPALPDIAVTPRKNKFATVASATAQQVLAIEGAKVPVNSDGAAGASASGRGVQLGSA